MALNCSLSEFIQGSGPDNAVAVPTVSAEVAQIADKVVEAKITAELPTLSEPVKEDSLKD